MKPIQLPPNATNEQKQEALKLLEEKSQEQKVKKKLLIVKPISIVLSLLYLFFGTAFSYKIFELEFTYTFSELAEHGPSLTGFLAAIYVPCIIALFVQAASLIILVKFPLTHKMNLAVLIIDCICLLLFMALAVGSFSCATTISATRYTEVNFMPSIICFCIVLLNLLAPNMLSEYKKIRKQIDTIKENLN